VIKPCRCWSCCAPRASGQAQEAATYHNPAEMQSGSPLQVCVPLPAWGIRAGARETIYHNPAETNVAIVTCGGLCPGLNDVVQGLVRKLEDYGVPEGNILGIRWAALHYSKPYCALFCMHV
jgi:6-phosphofructokinase 1